MNTPEKFWANVRIGTADECWPWLRAIDKTNRYGRVTWKGRAWKAHRLAFFLTFGDVPPELDHTCHDESCTPSSGSMTDCQHRRCCNPAHLAPATRSENMARMEHYNNRKTTCPRGHEYDTLRPDGRRHCSQCLKEYRRARYLANQEEAKARQREYRARKRAEANNTTNNNEERK